MEALEAELELPRESGQSAVSTRSRFEVNIKNIAKSADIPLQLRRKITRFVLKRLAGRKTMELPTSSDT